MKKPVWITGLLLVLLGTVFVARFVLGGDEDTWVCERGQWVKHGNPSSPIPSEVCE